MCHSLGIERKILVRPTWSLLLCSWALLLASGSASAAASSPLAALAPPALLLLRSSSLDAVVGGASGRDRMAPAEAAANAIVDNTSFPGKLKSFLSANQIPMPEGGSFSRTGAAMLSLSLLRKSHPILFRSAFKLPGTEKREAYQFGIEWKISESLFPLPKNENKRSPSISN